MKIEVPGVGIVEFPDGTPSDVIENALSQYKTGGVSTNSAAIDQFKGKMASGFDGAMQGGTFGFGDELAGVRGAVFGQNQGPDGNLSRDYSGTMGERYASERDKIREQNQQSQQQNPMQFGVGQVAGAAVPAVMTAPVATGATALGTAGRGAGLGAVEGALQGGGNANGQDTAGQMIKGGIVGAGLGVAAPLLVGAAGAAKNAVKDPVTGAIDGMLNRANTGKANRSIMEMINRSKRSPDDIGGDIMRASQEGQPEYRLMDAAGQAGQRRASGVVRNGGDGAEELAQFLGDRQNAQAERVGGFVEDAFGFGGAPYVGKPGQSGAVLARPQSSAASAKDQLKTARGDNADEAYSAARGNSAPVDIRGALGVIDNRIGGMSGSGVVGDSIDGKLSGYRSRLAADPAPNGEISRELSDFDRVLGVKQSIQDDIGAAARAGRNNEARELGKLMAELDAALEKSSDMYRTANDGFREASRVIDSVDEGADMAKRGRSADNVPAFQRKTPDQQSAARIGYGDNLLGRIEANTAPTANKAKALQSPKRDAEAQAMALQPDLYAGRLGRENAMWETQNRALGGSKTADNLQDIGDTGALADTGRAIQGMLSGNFGQAASTVASRVGSMAKGENDATRQLIARALMSKDPVKALAPALRQDMKSKSARRMIEALLRQPMREASSQ